MKNMISVRCVNRTEYWQDQRQQEAVEPFTLILDVSQIEAIIEDEEHRGICLLNEQTGTATSYRYERIWWTLGLFKRKIEMEEQPLYGNKTYPYRNYIIWFRSGNVAKPIMDQSDFKLLVDEIKRCEW